MGFEFLIKIIAKNMMVLGFSKFWQLWGECGYFENMLLMKLMRGVTTLAFSSRPRQGLAKVRAKYEARESHFMFLGVQESVREWTFTLPSELSFWELESWWTPKFLESDCRGQNPLDWGVPYIIGKFLECRCLKWARMNHLNI